jgi:alpha-mannosidase
MTSPQWFEDVHRPFTAHSLVDLVREDGSGLLVLHDGSQAWFREDDGVRCLLDAYDPWDEDHYRGGVSAEFELIPHAALNHARRWRLAREHVALPLVIEPEPGEDDLPRTFGPLGFCAGDSGVAVTAFFRECRKSFEGLERPFGAGVRNPYVVRLVELDGAPARVHVTFPGPMHEAARTNLMGEVQAHLQVDPVGDSGRSALNLELRPHEIATIMLDLELGRHVPRNLDDHRRVWATVHRQP